VKALEELIGKDTSKETLLKEVEDRERLIKELPPVGLLSPTPPTGEEKRFELEHEIQRIRSKIYFQDVIWPYYKVGFNEGRKSADKSNKRKMALHSHKEELKAKFFCIDNANSIWANNNSNNDEIIRIGEMCDLLYDELKNKKYWQPKDKETIRDWLKRAKKNGELNIPSEAQKGGRPSKK